MHMGLDSVYIPVSSAASVSVSWTELYLCVFSEVNRKSFCICFVSEVFTIIIGVMINLETPAEVALAFVK